MPTKIPDNVCPMCLKKFPDEHIWNDKTGWWCPDDERYKPGDGDMLGGLYHGS